MYMHHAVNTPSNRWQTKRRSEIRESRCSKDYMKFVTSRELVQVFQECSKKNGEMLNLKRLDKLRCEELIQLFHASLQHVGFAEVLT